MTMWNAGSGSESSVPGLYASLSFIKNELTWEVIAGKWGNGIERKNALAAAGYDYAAVQKLVNAMMA